MKRPRIDLSALLALTGLADLVAPFALRVAADLNLADCLIDGPCPVEELAARTGTDARALVRVLRCLSRRGVFEEVEPGCFGLTPLSRLLTSSHALSLRDAFPLIASDLRAWSRAEHAVRTGEAAFPQAHGETYWSYLARRPDVGRRVDRSVESSNRIVVRMFARLYDWACLARIVDLGGGNGSFLSGLLAFNPGLHGVVFDQPEVVCDAPRVIDGAGVGARCEVVSGSFFGDIPAGADAYLLKTILHDWPDPLAAAILRNVRSVIPPHGRLLVIEALLSPGNDYDIGKLFDVNSLVLAGGVDRSLDGFEALFHATGFQLDRVLRTTHALTLMEARPIPNARALH